MSMLDRLPASATLVGHDEPAGAGRSVADVLVSARERLAGYPADASRAVVGVHAGNAVETLEIILALLDAGAVPAPFTPDTPAEVVLACLDALGSPALWTATAGWQRLQASRRWPPGFEFVMHSSGSTGVPKPMGIRLEAMRRNALDLAEALSLSSADRHLGTMHVCYMSGLYNATMLPFFTGATSICLPLLTPLTLGTFLAAVETHRPSVIWINPLMARMLAKLNSVKREAFSDVRYFLSCTAPLHPDVRDGFEQRFGRPILQSYGLCETLITTMEDPVIRSAGSVGRPIGGAGAVVLDAGSRIVIANGALMAGYLDGTEPPFTGVALRDYATNDIGRFDSDHNLFVVGRYGYVINRGGVKFAPDTVEAVIANQEGVEDCAVVGMPEGAGETMVVALVVGGYDEARLSEALLAGLPRNQCPTRLLRVPRIPRTHSGKIDRNSLAEEAGKWL